MKNILLMLFPSFCGLCFLCLVADVLAESKEPEQLRNRLETSVAKASDVGRKTAAWEVERQRLIEQIQNLELKSAWAEFQLEKTEKWLFSEKNNIETLTTNLSRATATREQLEPFFEVLYADLESHVFADLPFLNKERRRRLAYIRSTLDAPEAQLSDKLGRLLEAMQVEVDYGYTVEVSEELIEENAGETVQAVVFRLGRLSLFRLLRNNTQLERYDSENNVWQPLHEEFIAEVEKAVEIARKKRVSSLLFLPIGTFSSLQKETDQALPTTTRSEDAR